MSETPTRHLEPISRPTAVGRTQATNVEMTRAMAQVQAAVVSAKNYPRDAALAHRRVLDACKQMGLAQRAFFRYSRGGTPITGPSVHLARTLAQCWGNVDFGLVELDRDDDRGVSEMLAYAADLETNTRSSTTFLVPHVRSAGGDIKSLTDPRDVYETLANNGARRMREMIFAVVPAWLVEEAKEACNATLRGGGGVPLAVRITKAIDAFAVGYGVSSERIERSLGDGTNPKLSATWDEYDVAKLLTIHQSLKNGETSVDEEFPPVRITGDDVAAQHDDDAPVTRAPRRTARRVQAPADGQQEGIGDDGSGVDPTTDPDFGKEPGQE